MTAQTYAWERDDEGRGHSFARVEEHPAGWTVHGTEVLVGEETLACTFRVRLDPDWHTREVEVAAVDASGERRLVLGASDGRWEVDGVYDPGLDGCVDVDVAATPLTNAFPIRRLASLPPGESRTSPVAWVEVPSLRVRRVDQTYQRLSPAANGGAQWEYGDPDHGTFRLTVDEGGVVIDYEGFARRIG
ncbi:putative glycolipid-binding domain-containing protein [Janibacter alittae]|uniref:Glycolipid-binding domain-containing protein n=1 Tax=Janibacter alittae TaxID=3115209 RepID=A0ABZ2MDM7_9MICO